MATIELITHAKLTIGDAVIEIGSKVTPVSLTVTGESYRTQMTLADNFTADTIWETGDGGIETFNFLYLESDANIFVQLRNDDSGTAEYVVLEVAANVPLILMSDNIGGATASRLDGAVLVDNTDYAQVDAIMVQRDVADAVGDATVNLWLVV